MRLSTLKTIGITTSLATIMWSGLVYADDVLSAKQQAKIDKIEQALDSLSRVVGVEEPSSVPSEVGDAVGPFDVPSSKDVGKDCDWLDLFNFHGVDDQGLNNSQFFNLELPIPPGGITPTTKHRGHDIEGLDSTRSTRCSGLWASSGDNDKLGECNTGCLYQVSKPNHEVDLIGDICTEEKDLVEVDGIAFRPSLIGPEELWGWAQHEGLFKIKSPEIVPGCGKKRPSVKAEMVCKYDRDDPTSEPSKNKFNDLAIEDITWNPKDDFFYVAIDNAIFKINPYCEWQFYCTGEEEIEALEYLPEQDVLVAGFHNPGATRIAAVVGGGIFCQFLPVEYSLDGPEDVEGLAHP